MWVKQKMPDTEEGYMRILVIGAGLIGSNLAADLSASGRDVTFLARGKWADTMDKNSLVIDPFFSQGRKSTRSRLSGN